jgi:hypothetical protein
MVFTACAYALDGLRGEKPSSASRTRDRNRVHDPELGGGLGLDRRKLPSSSVE